MRFRFSLLLWSRQRSTEVADGFTLMELLIVIAIILIPMLMAIPSVGVMKKHANETSAINSLRTITTAEVMYSASFPSSGFACSLATLGGDSSLGPPSPQSAHLIQEDLAAGYKSGYIFSITNCTKVTIAGTDHITGYTVTAVPAAVGKTGDRGFCGDENGGSPKFDPSGGASCTFLLQ
jgi:type IV pilus assembly protein PilA